MSQTDGCCCKGQKVKVCGEVTVDGSVLTPDLNFGQETAMNMRFMGKQVYATLVDFGNLPNNKIKSVAHGIENADWIHVGEEFSYVYDPLKDGTWAVNSPDTDAAKESFTSAVDRSNVSVVTGVNRSNFKAVFCLLYTKMDVAEG